MLATYKHLRKVVSLTGMGSNGITVTYFLQLLMFWELELDLGYFLSQIFTVVTATEVTIVPKFLA